MKIEIDDGMIQMAVTERVQKLLAHHYESPINTLVKTMAGEPWMRDTVRRACLDVIPEVAREVAREQLTRLVRDVIKEMRKQGELPLVKDA